MTTPAWGERPPSAGDVDVVGLAGKDDESLVEAVRGGDRAAFTELAERHAGWMQGLAARLLAHDHHLAQDVTQECLVRLHATITRDERPLRVRPWLAVVVRNACMDEHRRRRPEPLAEVPDVAVIDEDPFDVDPNLEQAWSALQPRFREVLHHRELLGLSYDEIADAMGTSRSAVQTLLFRARAALRREYQRAGGQLLGCGAFGLSLLASFDGERVHDAGRLAAHVGRCQRCQHAVDRMSQLSDLLRGLPVPSRHVDRIASTGNGLFHGLSGWVSSSFHEHVATLSQVAQTGLIVGTIPLSAVAIMATHPMVVAPAERHQMSAPAHDGAAAPTAPGTGAARVSAVDLRPVTGAQAVVPGAGLPSPSVSPESWRGWPLLGDRPEHHSPRQSQSPQPSHSPGLIYQILHGAGRVLPALPLPTQGPAGP